MSRAYSETWKSEGGSGLIFNLTIHSPDYGSNWYVLCWWNRGGGGRCIKWESHRTLHFTYVQEKMGTGPEATADLLLYIGTRSKTPTVYPPAFAKKYDALESTINREHDDGIPF